MTEFPCPLPDARLEPQVWPELMVVAATVLGEAEGESPEGKLGVAFVIRNRASNQTGQWPRDGARVCLQPRQFSCWDDPGRRRVMVDPRGHTTSKAWSDSFVAAVQAFFGLTEDPTHGANHYCTIATYPTWAEGKAPVATIGNHKFYRL